MSDKDEAHLLSGAYALDALTPEEAQALEAAMAESEELRGEVIGLVDTAVALGLAVPAATPPPALRAALLSALDETPQLAPEPGPVRMGPAATGPVQVQVAEAGSSAAPVVGIGLTRREGHLAPRRRPRMRRPALLLSMAAVAVLLFGGGVLVQRAVVEPQLQYSHIVAASDAQSATHPVVGGGTAEVTWSRSQNGTAVVLKDVDVPTGHVLQLWHVRGGSVTSAGLYEPTADGQYEVLAGVPTAGEQLAVSIEPAGGSTRPTGAVVVEVPLTA